LGVADRGAAVPGQEIVLVGGGNSAGQAAVFLREYAAKIWLLVRGPSLSESMSQYLIDRIYATSNIEVLTNTEIVALSGSPRCQLERIRWRNRLSGEETESQSGICFYLSVLSRRRDGCTAALLLIPKASCKRARACGRRSARVNTEHSHCRCNPASSGFFAVGDVRSGSVKRVGAAIGEGAEVVAQLHTYLASTSKGAAVDAASSTELPPGSPLGSPLANCDERSSSLSRVGAPC
jgi:thioredoxin reductase (NADPH)